METTIYQTVEIANTIANRLYTNSDNRELKTVVYNIVYYQIPIHDTEITIVSYNSEYQKYIDVGCICLVHNLPLGVVEDKNVIFMVNRRAERCINSLFQIQNIFDIINECN